VNELNKPELINGVYPLIFKDPRWDSLSLAIVRNYHYEYSRFIARSRPDKNLIHSYGSTERLQRRSDITIEITKRF